jgi:hypothetical protein
MPTNVASSRSVPVGPGAARKFLHPALRAVHPAPDDDETEDRRDTQRVDDRRQDKADKQRQSSGSRTRAGATKGTWAEYCISGLPARSLVFCSVADAGRMRPSQRSRLVSHSSDVYSGRQRRKHARRRGGDEMLKGKLDKSKLPSRHVTEGARARAAPVVFLRHGPEDEEIHQPFVGVATCWNEAAPCNIALSRQAQSVKLGVKHANGTPREFTTITVTDGIAMGHEGMRSSLASRDAIADTVELTMRGHCYDALVGLAGCDKSCRG